MIDASAIILAGGESRRLGMNKPFIRVGRFYLIEVVFMKLKALFPEIIIVTNEKNYLNLNEVWRGPIRPVIVQDKIPQKGPLGGLYTGLLLIKNQYAFVCACDMPFLNLNLIKYMFRHRKLKNSKSQIPNYKFQCSKHPHFNPPSLRGKTKACPVPDTGVGGSCYDAIVPELSPGNFETLHSFYNKNCIDVVEKNLKKDSLALHEILPFLMVHYILPEEIKEFDPEFESFININTQQDLKRLQDGILH